MSTIEKAIKGEGPFAPLTLEDFPEDSLSPCFDEAEAARSIANKFANRFRLAMAEAVMELNEMSKESGLAKRRVEELFARMGKILGVE